LDLDEIILIGCCGIKDNLKPPDDKGEKNSAVGSIKGKKIDGEVFNKSHLYWSLFCY
jgi:hypothetical protein